jgi:hypothetical protein
MIASMTDEDDDEAGYTEYSKAEDSVMYGINSGNDVSE